MVFTLKLFGGASLAGPDGPISGPAVQRQRVAILSLLATAKSGVVTRDLLLSWLWPEGDPDRSRHSLAHAVYALRRVLGDEAILSVGEGLRLNQDVVTTDVVAFEQALGERDLAGAVELYKGPFLDGVSINTREFELWLDAERSRLQRLYIEALEGLSEHAMTAGKAAEAAEWLRRAQVSDTYSTRLARELVTALATAGDRAGAMAHARVHTELLRHDLGIEPDAKFTTLVERVKAGTFTATQPERTAAPVAEQRAGVAGAEEAPEARGAAPPIAPRRLSTKRLAAAVGVLALGAFALRFALTDRAELFDDRVLVLPFENQTGQADLQPLSRMAADWVRRGLQELSFIDAVPPEATVQALPATLDSTSVLDLSVIESLGRRTGARHAVTGTYYVTSDSIRFTGRLLDTQNGRQLHTVGAVSGPLATPMVVLERLRMEVLRVVAATQNRVVSSQLSETSRLPSYEAYKAFTEAEDLNFRFAVLDQPLANEDVLAGFLRAWELDTTFTPALLRAASTSFYMGHNSAADSLAELVHQRRGDLSEESLAGLDLLRAMLRGDRREALRQAWRLAPNFAVVQAVSYNRPREALRALESLAFDWKDSVEFRATAYHMLGEHERELESVLKVRREHPDRLSLLVLEVTALAAMGEVDQVRRRIDESLTIQPEPRAVPATAMGNAAAEFRAHGYPEYATEPAERWVKWYNARPADGMITRDARYWHANAFYAAEQWEKARAEFASLAVEFPGDINYQGFLGVLAARRGDRGEALRISEALTGLNDTYDFGRDLYWQACIAALLGERERAMVLLRESFARGRSFGLQLHRDMDLEPLHGYEPFEEFLRPKG